MKILVAGATGVIGRQLLPLLQARGHDVVAVARRPRPVPAGVEVVSADVLDPASIGAVVRRARPEAVVNLLTAIPQALDPRRFATDIAPTNRLRTLGTANLVAAAGDAHLVSESVAFLYDPDRGDLAQESHPLWLHGPKPIRDAVAAVHACERKTLSVGGAVLRLGHLYGPGTHLAHDGSLTAQIRSRKLPLVGGDGSTFSFTHTRDVAGAVVTALESRASGTFNVVDDDPAPLRVWLPEVARLLDAPPPRRAPEVMVRLAGGGWGHAWMTRLVGASNDKARHELGWRPTHPSWRTGLAAELSPGASSEHARESA